MDSPAWFGDLGRLGREVVDDTENDLLEGWKGAGSVATRLGKANREFVTFGASIFAPERQRDRHSFNASNRIRMIMVPSRVVQNWQ